MKKLNKLFAILIAVLGVQTLQAQTWTAPAVPGSDLASLKGSGTNVGMYNVKADAFVTRAMDWSTQAVATKLHGSDSQAESYSNRHHVNVVAGSNSNVKFNLPCINNTGKWIGDGGQGSFKGVFTDNAGKNNDFQYSVVSGKTNVYTLKVATANSNENAYLDVWQPYGGQLTYANGQGFTEWAFIKFSDIENGKYALYKAKKAMYEVYQAVVAAGHESTYGQALSTARTAYVNSNATAASITEATKVLIESVSPALTQGYINANSLFTNPDMRGAGKKDDWATGYTGVSWGVFENWHKNQGDNKLTQTKTVPNGFYKVVYHGFWRQDGSDAAPTLTLSSGNNSVSANVPCMTDIDFGVTNKNNNNWTQNGNKYIPNGMQSAGEAFSHGDAQVTISDFVVSNGSLTITVNTSSASQWLIAQGFDIYFKAESLEEYANLFKEAKAAAEAIDKNSLNTYAAEQLTTALSNAASEKIDKEWYQERTKELNNVVTLANNIAAPYTALKKLLDLCNEYTDTNNSNANSQEVLTNFTTAINTATTTGNNASTAEAINTGYNNLEKARRIYAQNAVPVYPYAFDMTFLLANPNFDTNIDGWTANGAGRMDAGNIECYNNTFTFALANKLTGLGNGIWEVSVDGFYRYGGYNDAETAHNGGTEQLHAKFYANNSEVALKSIMEGADKAGAVGATTTGGKRVPNSPADGNSYFPTGCYSNTVSTLVTDGTLTFGLKKESIQSNDWTLFDNFRLVYKGIDVSELQTNLTILVNSANSIKDTKMGKTERTNLVNAISDADAKVTDADELNEMLSDLQSAYDAAVASIDTYSKVPAYIAKASKIDTSISANYQTQYDNRTLVGSAESIRQELNVATANYVAANFKNEIQLTEWGAESNAMWSASGEHWDGTIGEGSTSYYDANGTNTTHTLSKKVELTPGTYVFRGAGRAHPNTTLSLSVDIDGIEPAVFTAKNNSGRGIDKEGNATFADDAQYARDGQGQGWEWEFIKFTLNETTTVTLTATCQTNGWGWASFANNGLWMDDETYVVANAGALTTPKTKAEELVTKPMGATEKAALTTAIEKANGTFDTPAKLNAAIEALNNAIADAEPSIAKYEEVNAYITKANNIDESIAAEYQSQYNTGALSEDAVTIFQNLEVATYSYVMSNFTYLVALSDTWNSTGTNTKAATFSNEHWSGETREYKNQEDGDNWGWGASAWSIDFDQSVTLPAGEYVFKVAGRKSAGTTLELVVTMGATELGTVNDFPASNNSRGINKLGATSFDPEDEAGFARNGEGFGWQWRYVKFTLNAESTVKVAVHAEANEVHQWVSFGDYTLQMTEETYLEANKGGLDAPTAAAQALVNAVPMGAEEIEALEAALAMTYTTGAELLAKIEALETAIANANAWVPKYNEAKAPLVAALDRFEADYNDAQNGALNHMNKDRWATAISMAQAAAVAKDATDSYDGFAAATENLIAALDAAQVSVNEYSALDAAIKTAKPLYEGGNWGDQPFQRPISAKESLNTANAQAVYNAATADGEGVTSVTEALNNGLNGIVLNAPKEGTCYKIVMGDLTWTNNDNATMLSTKDKSLVFVKGGQSEDQGLYSINFIGKNNNYAHALIFNAVKNKINQYTISFIDNDGATRYICDGSVTGAGTGVYGIRTTTDAANALPVEVRATATEGVWNLYNTVAKELLGAQDAGFFTTARNNNLKIMEAPKNEVTLTFSSVGWATLILPFDAELPEGVLAYSCGDADETEGTLTLEEAESLKANTPYLMNSYGKEFTFSGYGLATKDNYTDGLFTGTYVNYETTNDGKTYVLQNINGGVAFYLVGEDAQPMVKPNRIYMTYGSTNGAAAPRFSFGRGEGTTSVDNMEPAANSQQPIVVYDLMGRKVTSMEKGGMYIVNGKKVIVK